MSRKRRRQRRNGRTIAFVCIAKDEEAALPRLLGSISGGVFDQAVLLDTGSTDRTVEVFEEWAHSEDLPLGFKVGSFEWCDDYAAARNAASELVDADWLCWADCDDEICGPRALRSILAQLPKGTHAVKLPYILNNPGLGTQVQTRIRLVRRGAMVWRYPIHEELVFVDPRSRGQNFEGRVPTWVHEERGLEEWIESFGNYLRAARRWWRLEPDHPVAKSTFLREQRNRCTLAYFERYGIMPWENDHAQAEAAKAKAEGKPVMRVQFDPLKGLEMTLLPAGTEP